MKRWICGILAFVILFTLCSHLALASAESVYLPENLTEIQAEAFAGNRKITSVVIPKSVESIGSRAFAGCTGLTDVYIGNNPSMEIATDAFEGCSGIMFHVYPDSNGELFALSHGFRRENIEAGSAAWERTMSMIGDAGFSDSYFNSPQWTTKRLIVRRTVDYLPDISRYNPIAIVEKGYYNIFIIQFDTSEDTAACYSALMSDNATVYVEEDLWHEADTVAGAGVVDAANWGTSDPMGFDEYAEFVEQNSSGTVKIAIVDSGVKKLSYYSSMLVDGRNMLEDIDGQGWSNDSANHGSVIASIIKDCVHNNSVRIIPVRVQGSSNQFDDELLAAGIDYAVEKGADIINLSMSFPQSGVVRDAINHAVQSGVTVVVAAGNDARNVSGVFPANMNNVVTVSGISPELVALNPKVYEYKLSAWSNYGAVDYCAPDNYINTTAYSNYQRYTSFAAPMIAAAHALVELDSYHSISDMNSSCILTDDPSSFGKGLPQLQLLASVNATSIMLKTDLPNKMKVGDTVELEWTVIPANATNQAVSAVSSNPNVLAVTKDAAGKIVVSAVGPGTANITLSVNNSTVSVTSKNILVEQPVTGITITGAPDKLVVGKSIQLSAQVTPENATMTSYVWQSNECVSVNQNGMVTGLSAGTAIIYAEAADGYGAKSNTLTFPVVIQPDAVAVNLYIDGSSVNGTTINMVPGATKTLTYSVYPAEAEQKVNLQSLNSSVATIDQNTGVITAVAPGTASILAVASTGNSIMATVTINVEEPVVLPTGLTLSSEEYTLNIGDTVTVNAVISPSNATNKTLTWTSSNTNIASVSSGGIVTAKASGTVNITASTHNGIAKSITFTVEVEPEDITLDETSVELEVGDTYRLYATVEPSDADDTVDWYSSKTSVATVSSTGRITAKAAGTATITAETVNGLTATCRVTVVETEVEPESITLDETSKTVILGIDDYRFYLNATVTPSDADDTVTWSSSNTSVATVSSSGYVTIKTMEDATVTITAKTVNGLKATCKITVINPQANQPESITLDKTSKTVVLGIDAYQFYLNATVKPSGADDTVTWSSSNTSVATVSSSGYVTIKAMDDATVTITAKTVNGLKATCKITVVMP